jgi:hypothetical protein
MQHFVALMGGTSFLAVAMGAISPTRAAIDWPKRPPSSRIQACNGKLR